MIGWILLAVLLLLIALSFVLRLGVLACYDQAGPWVKVRVGPKLVQVYPVRKDPAKEARKQAQKEAKAAKKAAKQAQKAAKPPKEPVKREVGGLLELLWDALPLLRDIPARLRDKLTIDDLTLHITWAEEDPADTGIHYGQGWAVLEALLAWLEAQVTVKERDVALQVDFLAEKPTVYIRAGLSMTLAQLLGFALWSAGRALGTLWPHRQTIFPPKNQSKPKPVTVKKGEPNHGNEASH